MKTTKRKEFIKWLIDKGLEVNTADRMVVCLYRGSIVFSINDTLRFQVSTTNLLERLPDVNIEELYKKIIDYASLKTDARYEEIELVRSENQRN